MMQRLLFFLLCSTFSFVSHANDVPHATLLSEYTVQKNVMHGHVRHEETTRYTSSYSCDNAGNPVAFKVSMHQILVPIVDGMRLEIQKEERFVEQEFPIHNQTRIQEDRTTPSFQIKKPDLVPSYQKQQNNNTSSSSSHQGSGFYSQIKIVPHQPTAFELMSNDQILELIKYDRYCRIWYHMTSSQKYKMMDLGYKKFEEKLLSDQTLQDWAVLELWNEYKNKRLWNIGEQKQIHEESIKHALEKRQNNLKKKRSNLHLIKLFNKKKRK